MATLTGLFTLGRDAETRVTQGGTTVVQLAVAYNYGRKGEDGKKPSQWCAHPCSASKLKRWHRI